MKMKAMRPSRHRRLLAAWVIAAGGTVTLAISPSMLRGAEPYDHEMGRQVVHTLPHGHHHHVPMHHAGHEGDSIGLQKADTRGIWSGYQPDGCKQCQAAPEYAAHDQCSCGRCGQEPHNPVYRLLDGLAGGIEHVMRLDRPARSLRSEMCDDGCDAVMLQELHHVGGHVRPMVVPTAPPLPEEEGKAIQQRLTPIPAESPVTVPQRPTAKPSKNVPAPVMPDAAVNPFDDEAAWTPGRNPAIERSAYFE